MQSAGLSARGFARNSPGGAQCSDWLDEEVTSLKIASFPALWEDKASGLALGLQPPIWAGRCGVCINVTNVSYLGAGLVRMDGPGRLLLASAAGSGGCRLYFPLILCLSSEATKVCKDGTARRNTGFFFFHRKLGEPDNQADRQCRPPCGRDRCPAEVETGNRGFNAKAPYFAAAAMQHCTQ